MAFDLGRVFAQSAVRKIAFVLVAAVLAAAGIGSARAHTLATACPNVTPRVCDEGQAVADIFSQQEHRCADLGLVRWSTSTITNVNTETKGGATHCRTPAGTGGSNWGVNNATWGGGCSLREDEDAWAPPGGTAGPEPVCSDGCRYEQVLDSGASNGAIYEPTGGTCIPTDIPPPIVDTDGDGVPDIEDAFPNDPGETTDTDGDGIGDNSDIAPLDPTNGGDGTQPPPIPPAVCGGEGQPPCTPPGDETDNVSSGGGTCDVAPTCSGDGIACNILHQTWKTRCAVESLGDGDGTGEGSGTATGGGDCNTPPVTTGDPVLGMVATQAWATRCATEAGNAANVTGDIGDCTQPFSVEGTNANAVKLRAMRAQICDETQPGWTEGDAPSDPAEGDPDPEPDVGVVGVSESLLDTENIFGAGSCPVFTVTIYGQQVSSSSIPEWCTIVSIMRAVVLLMGAFAAIRILLGD